MPELPEVETVRRGLEGHLAGVRILGAVGQEIMMRRALNPARLSRFLAGRRFTNFRRRGKYLLLDLDPTGTLLIHLGMSGRLLLSEAATARAPHTHLVLGLSTGRELRFVDPRRFGFVHLLTEGEEEHDPSLTRLGLEPLSATLGANLPALYKSRRAPVKSLLLDQRLVVGIGNIYAAEALWRARIRPTRRGCHVALARLADLASAVQEVLHEAIEQGGTTLRDFASPEGNDGYFAIRLAAYGREGEPCNRCGRALSLCLIAGRATAWCASCQR